MTVERATGLVLRTRPLTETSLIVHWLTPDLGRLATVAKGARRPKSPFRGKLDLFYLADFSFQRSRRSDLHTLREVDLRNSYPHLRQDYARLRQAAYGTLLVEQMTERETPLPDAYARLLELVECLNAGQPRPEYVLAFELRMLGENGLAPDWNVARLNPDARDLGQFLATADWGRIERAKPPAIAVAAVQHFLEHYLDYHLDRVPRGRAEALLGHDSSRRARTKILDPQTSL